MAVKKSELYSSLWDSCDQLRGSMDASQYKDYILVLLFMKYVSDRSRSSLVEIPAGASFADMIKLKGKDDIGDRMNKIIGAMARANELTGVITVADFNDDDKLGRGKDKVDRLTNLISIFERPELDFSKNMAEGDDLLGDAYEYLMRLFATESGKSKGQFYTPAEVSRIMAKLIGINNSKTQEETLYDPTCGSGSLLLKASDEAPFGITIYGQEYDNATRALCVMNMWLHNNPDSEILLGNTLSNPQFNDSITGALKQFDFAVANPPFSYKSWRNGWDPEHDIYKRFDGYALPPDKNGDYSFLLHMVKSLKAKGKGCIVMPLGVLFRGNSESQIRKRLVEQGYIKGIIGLPPNLFYGTGIAASLIVIDKEHANERTSIFMIDASKGFIKDGNKNRLREQDIHKIVDTFSNLHEIPKYSRDVPIDEISNEKNDFNLNIPRYIDSQDQEDLQDIQAHLSGGIPLHDVEQLNEYWQVFTTLKNELFKSSGRTGYMELTMESEKVMECILNHPDSFHFKQILLEDYKEWETQTISYLEVLERGANPKQVINTISENLLKVFSEKQLIDKYDVYQLLMDYWFEIMQDDSYVLSTGGWSAGKELIRLMKKNPKGVEKTISGLEGLEGRVLPTSLIIKEYLPELLVEIEETESELESIQARENEIDEEHGLEGGMLEDAYDDGKTTKKNLQEILKILGRRNEENAETWDLMKEYLELISKETDRKQQLKELKQVLEEKVVAKYPRLSEEEIKSLLVQKKWLASIGERVESELDNISNRLSNRIKDLAQRYEKPMVQIEKEVEELTSKVEEHLKAMGMVL